MGTDIPDMTSEYRRNKKAKKQKENAERKAKQKALKAARKTAEVSFSAGRYIASRLPSPTETAILLSSLTDYKYDPKDDPDYPPIDFPPPLVEADGAPKMNWDAILKRLVADKTIPNPLYRILLFGPPRTGKSTIARDLFGEHERATIHKQLPTEDLLGGYALVDGTTKWQDGPAIRALRGGKCLVLDEIDQISAECRCILHALLDDPPGITLASGERVNVRPEGGFCVIATTNQLPSSLPAAILDRFDLILLASTLAEGLRVRLGALASKADAVVGRGMTYNWSRPASVNLFIAAAKLRQKGFTDESVVAALGFQGKQANDMLVALR